MEEQKKLENILYRLQAQESCRNLIGKLCYLQATHESRKIIDLWSEREDTKLVVFGHIYNGAEGIKNYYLKNIANNEKMTEDAIRYNIVPESTYLLLITVVTSINEEEGKQFVNELEKTKLYKIIKELEK